LTEQQRKLAEENHNLIYSFLQKYHLPVEDWYGVAAIGFCKAIMKYKEGVSKFSTFAYRCMFTAVMHEKRKEKAEKAIPSYQILYYQSEFDAGNDGDTINYIDTIPSLDDVEGDALAKVIFEEFFDTLKPQHRTIFRMFQGGYTQREIGNVVGCSQVQVSRVKRKLLRYLAE